MGPAVLTLILAAEPSARLPVAEVWKRLPKEGSACAEALNFDYGLEGGMRNFYCRARQVLTWKAFVAWSPAPIFASGPHGGELVLDAPRTFGHYDPAFVRWAATALIPAATDDALRKQTQATFDAQVRPLARTWYLVWRAISAQPTWLSLERTRYAEAMARGEGDWAGEVVNHYHDTVSFPGSDPNLVRSATMWWLRRSLDETAPLWLEGLERLLRTYDARWLATAKQSKARAPLRATKP